MIYYCKDCNSTNIYKNGFHRCGKQQYRCKDCGSYKYPNTHPAKVKRQKLKTSYVLDTAHNNRHDVLQYIKDAIKNMLLITGEHTAIDKHNLSIAVHVQYKIPIGETNGLIERVKRANGVL